MESNSLPDFRAGLDDHQLAFMLDGIDLLDPSRHPKNMRLERHRRPARAPFQKGRHPIAPLRQIDPRRRACAYSRFGRGRGSGTRFRTTTAFCSGLGIASEVAGLRTKAIASLDDLVSPAGDLWMEPVISS
jgi:hypothetical protein